MSGYSQEDLLAAYIKVLDLADRIESPYAHQVFLAKKYSKADLIRDLRAIVPVATEEPRKTLALMRRQLAAQGIY